MISACLVKCCQAQFCEVLYVPVSLCLTLVEAARAGLHRLSMQREQLGRLWVTDFIASCFRLFTACSAHYTSFGCAEFKYSRSLSVGFFFSVSLFVVISVSHCSLNIICLHFTNWATSGCECVFFYINIIILWYVMYFAWTYSSQLTIKPKDRNVQALPHSLVI